MNNNEGNPCVQFVSDGVNKEYNFTFEIFDINNIELYLGEEIQEKGFYIIRDKEVIGGKVIFDEAPKVGTIVTILRHLPIKRTTDFKEGGPFRASKINYEFDYQLGCIQQVAEKLSRVVCKPPYFLGNADLTLPFPDQGKAIIWNNEGTSLKNSDISIDEIHDTYIAASKLFNDSKNALADIGKQAEKIDIYAESIDNINEKMEIIESNIIPSLNKKAEVDFSNSKMKDYIIENWLSESKNCWYRKYNTGWIEQGGFSETGSDVIFPKPFVEKCFSAHVSSVSNISQGYLVYMECVPTLTLLKGKRNGGLTHSFLWTASGI